MKTGAVHAGGNLTFEDFWRILWKGGFKTGAVHARGNLTVLRTSGESFGKVA